MHRWGKKEKYILLMGKERKQDMNNLLVTKELLGRQEEVPAVLLLVKTMKTRPSILWLTHQMSRKNGNYLVGSTLRYEMMNYKAIPVGT